jgi:catechol 2,3-dioxygenase-like lactoylglutathione lyase family enzyme
MTDLIFGIRQIALTVSDVEKALAFYREILGLEFLFAPSAELAFVQAGDIRIMLSTPQGAGAVGANSILYFSVEDIESTFEALVAKGAEGERPPALAAQMPDHQLWIGFIKDPDGNLVGLLEEKRP